MRALPSSLSCLASCLQVRRAWVSQSFRKGRNRGQTPIPKMWFILTSLAALAFFIVWDSRRLSRSRPAPLSRGALKQGFTPRGLIAWHFWLGMGLVVALLAWLEWETPSNPPFSGRWGWLHQGMYEAFGARGIFGMFASMAIGSIAYGLFLRRRKSREGNGGESGPNPNSNPPRK